MDEEEVKALFDETEEDVSADFLGEDAGSKPADPEPEKSDAQPPEPEKSEEAEALASEAPPQEEAQQVEQPGDDGKHHVPLAKFLEERNSYQEKIDQLNQQHQNQMVQHQNQLAQFQAQITSLQQSIASQAPQPDPIDPELDPGGYIKNMGEQLQQQTQTQLNSFMLSMSEANARQIHGSDVVDAALTAIQANPQAAQQLAGTPDPVGGAVNWHKQQRLLAQTGGDLDAYNEKLKAEAYEKAKQDILAQARGGKPMQPGNATDPAPSLGEAGSSSLNVEPILTDKEIFDKIWD